MYRDLHDPQLYHFPTPEQRELRELSERTRSWYAAGERYRAALQSLDDSERSCIAIQERGLAAVIARFNERGASDSSRSEE